MRQVCCHPRLVGNDSPSGKTETLFELLDPLVAEGQKVLVFSASSCRCSSCSTRNASSRQISTHILTGDTKDRQQVVQAFQDDEKPGVFLLSLRAAGTGLNLTTASYVVLYDPWWNPAVEAQAIDRSHRIGQTQTVNAYRLIAPGTVEEKIWELQQQKAQTIADVLGEEGFARSLSPPISSICSRRIERARDLCPTVGDRPGLRRANRHAALPTLHSVSNRSGS